MAAMGIYINVQENGKDTFFIAETDSIKNSSSVR